MTREEYGTDGNVYQMSISNGKEFSTCGDVVSREAITEHLKSIAETIDVKEIGGDYNTGFYDGLEFAIDFVITLPSVQPAQITPNQKTESMKRLTNAEWKDFLSEQFDISRTSAKEMLHAMMSVKKEDNFKKQFSGRKAND